MRLDRSLNVLHSGILEGRKAFGNDEVPAHGDELEFRQHVQHGRGIDALPLPAEKAAELAIKLAKEEPVGEKTQTINNGKKDVPSVLIEPVAIDKNNLASTVVADGFHKVEDVYKDVPKDQ